MRSLRTTCNTESGHIKEEIHRGIAKKHVAKKHIQLVFAPAGNHRATGLVERCIRTITKEILLILRTKTCKENYCEQHNV